ncbi:MAG: hypothetical protein ACI30S_02855 [Muribaculaceae bacterium]
MRKVFTLIVVFAVALSSVAAVNGIKRAGGLSRKACELKGVAADSRLRSATPSDFPGEEYWSIGNGYMTDDMIAPLYGLDPVTYIVEVQQCAQNQNYYRIIAPYGRTFAEEICKQLGEPLNEREFDYKGVCYIDIDATNPDDVYFGKTMTGCDWGYGEMYIGIASTGTVTFKDGVFSASINGLAVGDDSGAVAANKHGKFRILLPGVTPSDYDIELTPESQCLTDLEFKCNLTVGADVATVKYAVITDMQEDEMVSYVNKIAEEGAEFSPRGDFSYNMAYGVKKETLIVVALSAGGETVGYDWVTYYFIDDDADNWESAGTAIYHDAIIPQFTNVNEEDLECELQRYKLNPDYLRLVNPYATASYAQERYYHSGHNHYIYINANDLDCIYVEESPLGLDFGGGLARISSYVYYFLQAGYDFEECKELGLGAYYEDNVLTFDDEMLLFSMLDYENGDWYVTTGGTMITLPEGFEFAGVESVVADDNADSKAELYNLQGMRVVNPREGQLYILRKGSSSRKVVF